MGFRGCDQPEFLMIDRISVSEEQIQITGVPAGSGLFYDGYIATIEEDILYLGINTRTFFASSDQGSFQITIPTNSRSISKIILTNGEQEIEIYSK